MNTVHMTHERLARIARKLGVWRDDCDDVAQDVLVELTADGVFDLTVADAFRKVRSVYARTAMREIRRRRLREANMHELSRNTLFADYVSSHMFASEPDIDELEERIEQQFASGEISRSTRYRLLDALRSFASGELTE